MIRTYTATIFTAKCLEFRYEYLSEVSRKYFKRVLLYLLTLF